MKRLSSLPVDLRRKLDTCTYHPDRILFLDIETTGLSHFYDEITIVGWTLDKRSGTFVRSQDSSDMFAAFESASVIVTFNGIRFDARFLRQEFPTLRIPEQHIDLMYLCRRVGLKGGQKAIEKELGIEVRGALGNTDGAEAVLLWHAARRGDMQAFERLIDYNRADIAAMGFIFDAAWERLETTRGLFESQVRFSHWSDPPDRFETANRFSLPRLPPAPIFQDVFGETEAECVKVAGIDLTGSEKRGSGYAELCGGEVSFRTIHTDADLLDAVRSSGASLVSIDSPLCLPFGRTTVFDDDPMRETYGIMRLCERELKQRGINVYPSLLPSMQKLTARGIGLADTLRAEGIPVIESYPGAAQDIMRIPRKGAGLDWLRRGLAEFGIGDLAILAEASHDELDAITSALVGVFHWVGLSEELDGPMEPPLIIPDLKGKRRATIIGISGAIASGKTTAATLLQEQGFEYTRFSIAIDARIEAQGLTPDRETRQRIGAEVNERGEQRALAQETLSFVQEHKFIAVDGLRFPSDHSYLAEFSGASYHHIHIETPTMLRRQRYDGREREVPFDKADNAKVERMVTSMKELAHITVENDASITELNNRLAQVLADLEKGQTCQ